MLGQDERRSTIRLGALYALEQLSTEAPTPYAKLVSDVLAAFLHDRARRDPIQARDSVWLPEPLDWSTGLLHRRPVIAGAIKHIGKEANHIEDREAGLIDAEEHAHHLVTYREPIRSSWPETLAQLQRIPVKALAADAGISQRRLRDILTGRAVPRARTRSLLEAAAHRAVGQAGVRLRSDPRPAARARRQWAAVPSEGAWLQRWRGRTYPTA